MMSLRQKTKQEKLKKWSEDGSTSISPAEYQQPADTDNISALDQTSSNTKDTTNLQNTNESEEKIADSTIAEQITEQETPNEHPACFFLFLNITKPRKFFV